MIQQNNSNTVEGGTFPLYSKILVLLRFYLKCAATAGENVWH